MRGKWTRKRSRKRSRRIQTSAAVYPSPAERERIVERRDKLLREMLEILVVPQADDRKMNNLIRRYGPQEVHLVLSAFQKRVSGSDLIGNEAAVYRGYRRAFARFGGNRPFLSAEEQSDLSVEHAELNRGRTFKSIITRKPGGRERELNDLLLASAPFWEDVTPLAVPPRPPDFDVPSPSEYGYPARQLLKWGWDWGEAEEQARTNARNVRKWRPAVEDLVQMALDEGLLNGWPGELASWAPYHALNMLGHLRAHEVAGRLFPLFEQENDWLSDRLAVVWGLVGSAAEPSLWEYLENSQHGPDQRSVVMLGLKNIAEADPQRRPDIVRGLARLLRQASADDAEANAYLVHILNRLEATEGAEVITRAFEQGKVDERIMTLEDVGILDWDDPELYDRFYGQH
jgi:hypothetical protein